MIAIIDSGIANLASMAKACKHLGARVTITSNPKTIQRAKGVIFPGVGAFGAAMKGLRERKLIVPIHQTIAAEKPFLGVCLGLQLLLDSSEESPRVKGLGVFEGAVQQLPQKRNLKVPHMGWNQIASTAEKNPLLKGIPEDAYMYFVHSFYAAPKRRACIAAKTDYGVKFPSVLWDGNRVWATQFHPEKSQKWGLKLLNNFLTQVK